MYDAIVIGARCAGSPTAMLLAQKGYRVLLVDKATFPSDTMSTHYIHPRGVAHLKRWGVLEQVIDSNCPPVAQATFDLGPFALVASTLPVDGVAAGYGPRRTVLDTILVEAAVKSGAELRAGFSMQELMMDGERVIGIRGRSAGGVAVTEEACLVIGADGMRSLVARSVLAPEYHRVPSLSCGYYSYWSGIDIEGVEFYPREGSTLLAFPTNDELVCVACLWPQQLFPTFRADIEGNFNKTLDLAPALAERVRLGKREERFVGTADVPNFFRKPYGPGWALAGDAGYHKDPILAHGISDAFRDAELLAAAVHTGLSGQQSLEEALAAYEQWRNEAALPFYELTMQFARLEPPSPEMQQLFAAMRGNQKATDRYFATIEGTISPAEFFFRRRTSARLWSRLLENMIEFVVTIVINKPLAEVFRFVAHLEHIPQWVRGAHLVILSEGPFGDGTLFQQDHEMVRVDHVQVDHGFETKSIRIHFPTRLVLKHSHGVLQFEPVDRGTQFTMKHRFELTPVMKPFESRLARKAQRESQAALEHLKTLLEQETDGKQFIVR